MSRSQLKITPHDEGMLLSREEFAEADCEAPWRYERVGGRLVVMSPAGHEHHATTAVFRDYLGAYKLAHPDIVEYVFQESWTAVDDETDRIPDICVYLQGGTGQLPDRVPDLIFEIVSEGTADRRRDYEEKRADYRRIGVQEYVIVDRFEHRVTVLRLEQEQYTETIFSAGGTYRTPLLPGFEVPLQRVFAAPSEP